MSRPCRRLGLFLGLVAGATLGCSSEDSSDPTASAAPPLTDVETHLAVHQRTESMLDPRSPEDRDQMRADGWADLELGTPWEHVERTVDDSEAPAPGPNARRLVSFAHLADTQLADDESPARLVSFDGQGATGGAFRPQEGHECHLLNAAVKSLNSYNAQAPLDFVLLGGDNIDNAQFNEARWFLDILAGGSTVECDSGEDDDPIAGDDNDGKDAFTAAGLDVPYYWVTGNHDVLVQGNFTVESQLDKAIGDNAISGTRDWTQPGGPIVTGTVPADPDRRLLTPEALMTLVSEDGGGHGLGTPEIGSGRANYTLDVPDTPLRFVILDTTASTGSADALIRTSELDGWIRPTLDTASAEGKWVVLSAHHSVASLTDGSGFGGSAQDDAVTPEQWEEFIAGYPNVLFSIVGHSHVHRVNKLGTAGGHQWWEVLTSALADYPSQMRIIEIWDQDNGFIAMKATAMDVVTEGDPVAAEGKALSVMDWVAGWSDDGVDGGPEDKNVMLYVPKP